MKLNTVDVDEVSHFKKFGGAWWDENGPFRILHDITPLRVSFIKDKASIHFRIPESSQRPLKDLRILDVGCGGGLLSEPLARMGAEVIGIDPIDENIQSAKEHAEERGVSVTYFSSTIEDLPNEYTSFDIVIASEIIEHVSNPDGFLKACTERLNPNGSLVITTFNKTLKSFMFGVIAAEYILRWAPRGTHHWDKFIKPEDLSKKCLALGLENQSIQGLEYYPLSRQWKLSSSTDINYFLWAGRAN